jgi:uncharacterized membrane protein HdeD (DUF308 family)
MEPNGHGGSYLIGSVQVILGIIVVLFPFEPIPAVWVTAGTWCIITGILLLLDAQRLRTQAIIDKEKINN